MTEWLGMARRYGPWAGWAVALVLLIMRLSDSPSAPVAPPVVMSAGSASVKGGKQIVRVPYAVPGATLYIEVMQDCPELIAEAKTEVVPATCPPPHRVTLTYGAGYNGKAGGLLGLDCRLFGRWHLGVIGTGPTPWGGYVVLARH